MDDTQIKSTYNRAQILNKAYSSVSRLPLGLSMISGFIESVGLVALSQPIAKRIGWTSKTFGEYMKHPIALTAIAVETISVPIRSYLNRIAVNGPYIEVFAGREINNRKAQKAANDEDFPSVTIPAPEPKSTLAINNPTSNQLRNSNHGGTLKESNELNLQ
jgi:hypothetical protein